MFGLVWNYQTEINLSISWTGQKIVLGIDCHLTYC